VDVVGVSQPHRRFPATQQLHEPLACPSSAPDAEFGNGAKLTTR